MQADFQDGLVFSLPTAPPSPPKEQGPWVPEMLNKYLALDPNCEGEAEPEQVCGESCRLFSHTVHWLTGSMPKGQLHSLTSLFCFVLRYSLLGTLPTYPKLTVNSSQSSCLRLLSADYRYVPFLPCPHLVGHCQGTTYAQLFHVYVCVWGGGWSGQRDGGSC